MDKQSFLLLRRLIAIGAITAVCGIVSAANLVSLQIIHGDEYMEQADKQSSYTRTISAARGEIQDKNGVSLVQNKTMYVLRLDYAAWDRENQNQTILKLAEMVNDDPTALLNTSLPIYLSGEEYKFSENKKSTNREKLEQFCEENGWNSNLTANQTMEKLCDLYDIKDFSKGQTMKIARVRYQMTREQFSMYNQFTIATNISKELVAKVMERHLEFSGTQISTQAERVINTAVAGNILGYTGPIYAEDWDKYSEQGYSMDSIVGKTGAEQAFEEYLHGTDGQRTIQTDSHGTVLSEETTKKEESGNTIQLTIDIGLQEFTEQTLATRCQSIEGADGGAAVVIDVKTGEILALANYPTYNLQTFQADYADLVNNDLSPLVNRSIASVYAPGSTFKPITAVAGLEEGVIDRYTSIFDSGVYTFYEDYQPKCWYYNAYGTGHGAENVVTAIEDSCNYFFYETGRLLGGKKLEKYAKKFGLGQYSGIELSGEKTGTIAGPTARAEAVKNGNAEAWSGGDVLQAAIGQGDNAYTPIQLANYCAAIANGGDVHSAHLLKAVRTYDGAGVVKENDPDDISNIHASEETWSLVREGMSKVTGEDGTAAEVFENYSIAVAGKSGTAQRAGKQDNGLFISYAPFDNPEIAVCVVIEGGDSGNNVAPVVRDIYNYYFYGTSYDAGYVEPEPEIPLWSETDGGTAENEQSENTEEETPEQSNEQGEDAETEPDSGEDTQ